MMHIVIKGVLMGLLLSVLIGATFFLLVETSISKGGRIALAMAIGIFTSDLFCISLAYYMTSELIESILDFKYSKLIAGAVFVAFGIRNIFLKKVSYHVKEMPNKTGYLRSFIKGFIFNLINPAVIAFWLGAVIIVSSTYQFSRFETFLYFGSTLGTIFSFDVLKIYFSRKLRRLFTNPRSLKRMHQIIGIILLLFGIALIFKLF
ncbi:MAG: LysE family transporter [Bacteroidales bacterium]|nr:LysE family transporter [Bacteroidales bacterium]